MDEPMNAIALDEASLAARIERLDALKRAIARVVVGQDEVVEQLLIALLAGGHCLLEGVPGLGKTLLIRSLGQALHLDFHRIQFTPDLMPSDILGTEVLEEDHGTGKRVFKFQPGPVFTHLLLADELNRTPPKTQAALLEAMQERTVSTAGQTFALPKPFFVLATQNPLEQAGTYPLPEAQLDRFLLKILMNYPSHSDEVRMVEAVSTGRVAHDFDLSRVSAVAKPEVLLGLQQASARVHIDPVVLDYAVRICRATREWSGLSMGAGPRGSLALVRAARAQALLSGRDFVTPDDLRAIAKPALRHRLSLSPELQIEGRRIDDVLDALLQKVEAPRQ
jgi:MoxR-like ATPase